MKERIIKPEGSKMLSAVEALTNTPPTPYSKGEPLFNRGGDIFMEGKPDMSPANLQPAHPEYSEKATQAPKLGREKPVSPEKQAAVRKAATAAYGDLEKLPFDQRQAVEAMIEMGRPPVSGGAQQPGEPGEPAAGGPVPETSGAGQGGGENHPATAGNVNDADEPPSEFKDIRLRDISKTIGGVEEGGKGIELDFINTTEDRISRILDERDFVDEKERAKAQELIGRLIRLRSVSSESQTTFKQDLGNLFAKTEFLGMKKFLAEASGTQVRNYEQLERIHAQLGSSFNADREGIDNIFIARARTLQEKINEEARGKGMPPRVLNDAERDQLSKDYQGRMRALLDSRKSIKESLEKNFGSARRGLTAAQQASINSIETIEKKIASLDPEKEEFQIGELRKSLRNSVLELSQPLAPENEPLPDEILIAIAKDQFATEEFMDRLTRLPQEGKPYHLPGMYSDINLVKFLRLNEDLMSKKDMDHVSNVVAATEVIHEMNRILRTNIDQFAQVSQSILASHLTALFQVPGVQDAYELYEDVIKENSSIEMVFTEQVYDAIDEQVEKELSARREKKVRRNGREDYLMKSFKGEGRMEDWEKKRALIFGRNLVRTLLREGEHISPTSLPQASDGDARSTFISYAQNQLLNVFNPFTFTQGKFKPGESQGGVEMIEEYHKEGLEKRRKGRDDNDEKTKGIVRLGVVQGVEVKNIEATVPVGTRGAMMTWRGTDAGLLEFAMMDNGKPSNIKQFFTDHSKEISLLKDIDSRNRWEAEFKRTKGVITDPAKPYKNFEDWKKARVEQVFGPLLSENAVALGTLVSPIPLPGGMPTELKKILWERIADLNPDTMASILTRLEVDGEAEGAGELKGVMPLEEILLEHFGTEEQKKLLRGQNGEWRPKQVREEMNKLDEEFEEAAAKMKTSKKQKDIDMWTQRRIDKAKECDSKRVEFRELENQVKSLLRCEQWTALRGKLRTIHGLRMGDEAGRITAIKNLKPGELSSIPSPKMTINEYFSDSRLFEEDMITTEKEKAVIDAISQNGKRIAQDLANIKRAHVWFLEDVPTALMKWENLGQSFYRMITDFAQMNQTANETNALLLDPFKIPTEKALEHLAKMIQGSGSVLGIEGVQDNLFDIVMLWNKWQRIKPAYRQKFIEMIRSAGEKDLSIAQEVSRDTGAGAWDEEAAHAVLLTENHLSIIRKEKKGKYSKTGLFEKAEKILQCGLFDRLVKSKARDWLIFFLLGFIVQGFKEVTSPKPS